MKSLYQKTARLWSIVFLVVGLLFLIAPERTAEALTAVGHVLSLSGVIRMPRETIGYVLALSLMAVLTLLAYRSSRNPDDPFPYHALMLSKFVSTAAFIGLAWKEAPVWAVGAFTDGFVALTLWGTRRRVSPER